MAQINLHGKQVKKAIAVERGKLYEMQMKMANMQIAVKNQKEKIRAMVSRA